MTKVAQGQAQQWKQATEAELRCRESTLTWDRHPAKAWGNEVPGSKMKDIASDANNFTYGSKLAGRHRRDRGCGTEAAVLTYAVVDHCGKLTEGVGEIERQLISKDIGCSARPTDSEPMSSHRAKVSCRVMCSALVPVQGSSASVVSALS
jgi:hypothetical protein